MKIDILTLFPGMFAGVFEESIIAKAKERGLLDIAITNIRDHATDKHHVTDDEPFGGGAGMVMKADVLGRAVAEVVARCQGPVARRRMVLLSPQGKKFDQEKAKQLSQYSNVVLICGRYEGVDERVMDVVDEEISIGDFVNTGGEIPAMIIVDAVARMIPEVLGDEDSAKQDSFYYDILDHDHYTRPAEIDGVGVPEVLICGDHDKVRRFRRSNALGNTLFKRPDLLAKAGLNDEDKLLLKELIQG
ncbi:MAG: tRNA (guanosine(37)-N1)-methyltransferase TrmD [bacterium]